MNNIKADKIENYIVKKYGVLFTITYAWLQGYYK